MVADTVVTPETFTWLIYTGSAKVTIGDQTITASPGQWLLPRPVARLQQFTANIEILSLNFYANWPTGEPLFGDRLGLTLNAAKTGFGQNLIAVFQPHRYTRTQALLSEFFTAFYQADQLFVTEIYPAGETPIPGVHGGQIAEGVAEHGHRGVTYVPVKEDLVDAVLAEARPDDMVLTLGAGDIWRVGEEIARRLEAGTR